MSSAICAATSEGDAGGDAAAPPCAKADGEAGPRGSIAVDALWRGEENGAGMRLRALDDGSGADAPERDSASYANTVMLA
jgi:hypothetical protein